MWFSGILNLSNTEVAVCYQWHQWWKQWQNVQSRSICTGSDTSDSRYQGLVVEFQDYWAGLTSKSLGGSSGSSGRTSNPGLFALEVLLVIVDVKAWWLNFRTIEPVLHSSRWVEEEKLLPLSAMSAILHLLPKKKDLFGSFLSGWLNFRTVEPVSHSSRSVV